MLPNGVESKERHIMLDRQCKCVWTTGETQNNLVVDIIRHEGERG